MTLSFTWTLKGHCKIIKWPNFNIVLSQEIGPRRGRKMGRMAGQWNSQNTHIYQVYHLFWTWFMTPQNNYTSNIKDHQSQITTTIIVITKMFEILWELQIGSRYKVSICYGKNGKDRLAWGSIARKLQFLKITVSVKCD